MYRILLFLVFLQVSPASFSQFVKIAESSAFKEPKNGFAKLLMLKNGNTMYFHIDPKGKFQIKLFDGNYQEKVSEVFDANIGNGKKRTVEAAFEVGGKVIVMVSEDVSKIPTLFRIVIDPANGNLISGEAIARFQKARDNSYDGWYYQGELMPKFLVRKDPNSGYYAIALLGTTENVSKRGLEIIWYGPDNMEIRRANCLAPEGKFNYMRYLDMAVIAGEQVNVLAYASNTASAGKKEGEPVLAILNAKSSEVTLEELPVRGQFDLSSRHVRFNESRNFDFSSGLVRYDSASKQILLLVTVDSGEKSERNTKLIFFDPVRAQVIKMQTIFPERVNDEFQALFGKTHPYTGNPQDVFINSDGSFIVAFEERELYICNTCHYAAHWTRLGSIAICRYDAKGNEVESHLIPKNQYLSDMMLAPYYHSAWRGSAVELLSGDQYKAFTYLAGKKHSYILINDLEKNGQSVNQGDISNVLFASQSDGFYLSLDGSGILPGREFFLGKPDRAGERKPFLFAVSDYDWGANTFVTIALEIKGKTRNFRIVWLQPN